MAGPFWIRVDVNYFRHPKVLAAGPAGRDLHLAAICWCAEHLTDGHIPPEAMPGIVTAAGVKRAAIDRAVAAHLLIPFQDGWLIHDYLAHQDSRAKVEQRRKAKAERMARWRENRGS